MYPKRFRQDSPAKLRHKIMVKEQTIKNLRREMDILEMKQAVFEYNKAKGRNTFPFSYED